MVNSEDYSFTQKIVEGGIWMSAASLVVKFLGLVSTLVVLKYLTVHDYGVYGLVLAVFGFLGGLFVGGLDSIITNDLARYRGEANFGRLKRLFLEYGSVKTLVGSALFLLTFFGAELVGELFGNVPGQLLRTISFLFVFYALERMLHILFEVNLKYRLMSLFTIVEESIKFILIIFLVVWLGKGVGGLVLAYTLTTVFTFFLFLPKGLVLARFLFAECAAKEPVLKSLLKAHGKWGLAAKYINDTQKSIRPWLIQHFISIEAVGLYSLAEGLYLQIASLLPVANILAPLLPREIKNQERMRKTLLYGIKYGTLLFVAVAAASFLLVPRFLELFFPKYLPVVPLFMIMLIAYLTTAAANIVNTVLYSYCEQKSLFLLTLARIIFMVSVSTLFIRLFGIVGIAIEYVLTLTFFVVTRYYVIFKIAPELSIPIRYFFRFGKEDWVLIKNVISHFCHLLKFKRQLTCLF